MTLEDLHKIEFLSLVAFNQCKINGLNTFQDLMDVYQNQNSFTTIVGRRSNQELVHLCKNYQLADFERQKQALEKRNLIRNIEQNLTDKQRATVNKYILRSTYNLTEKNRNKISKYVEAKLDTKSFVKYILISRSYKTSKLKNIDEASILEINRYLKDIEQFLINLSSK